MNLKNCKYKSAATTWVAVGVILTTKLSPVRFHTETFFVQEKKKSLFYQRQPLVTHAESARLVYRSSDFVIAEQINSNLTQSRTCLVHISPVPIMTNSTLVKINCWLRCENIVARHAHHLHYFWCVPSLLVHYYSCEWGVYLSRKREGMPAHLL